MNKASEQRHWKWGGMGSFYLEADTGSEVITFCDSLPRNKMCIIFLTPVDCTGQKKITGKAKESFWPQLASDIERNNVKFRDLAPECGICREDVTVLPFDHKLQNGKGETLRGLILPPWAYRWGFLL
ncbi:hypothetical protein NW765_003390 [Fusarium oxysporum]|nr:hypothetical protein FOWG_01514 [Fusarium oxysporum f. sp. lycopersici MN25]KAJ4139488.1 hypothetical protein NW765_003390 [Fusarium oxysporum]